MGLFFRVVIIGLFESILTVVSKKLILSVVCSDVNLMVGWSEFRCSTNCFCDSSPCVQIRKISSMNLFQIKGLSG